MIHSERSFYLFEFGLYLNPTRNLVEMTFEAFVQSLQVLCARVNSVVKLPYGTATEKKLYCLGNLSQEEIASSFEEEKLGVL